MNNSNAPLPFAVAKPRFGSGPPSRSMYTCTGSNGWKPETSNREILVEKNVEVAVEIVPVGVDVEIGVVDAVDCQGGPGRIARRALRTRKARNSRKPRMARLAGVAG